MQNLNFNNILKQSNYHRPLLFNGGLWLLAFFIILFIFSKGQTPITADYIYTLSFLIVVAIPVNLNFYVLMPKFLKLERYAIYCLLFVTNYLFFAFLANQFFKPILDVFFQDFFFVSYLSKIGFYTNFAIILIASTLFKLAEDWFYFNNNQNRNLKQQNQHINKQLLVLRAQINPHFLFNSLNVIYAMALEKNENITTAIVELSDVLRYVIYDSDTERVALKEELKLIKNYISFQKYRGQTFNKINLDIDVKDETFKIHPMLLLPLIENAYKYGFSGDDTSENITIKIQQKANNFCFLIKNKNQDQNNKLEDNYSGFGLKNLKDNLNLVYPNQHLFSINTTNQTFTVILKLTNAK